MKYKLHVFSAVLVLILCALITRMQDNRAAETLTDCKSNLRDIAIAMEMYSTDWGGRYPPSLNQLVPNYLKTMPVCPNRLSGGYGHEGAESAHNEAGFQDFYYLYCSGENHVDMGLEPNKPSYACSEPLGER